MGSLARLVSGFAFAAALAACGGGGSSPGSGSTTSPVPGSGSPPLVTPNGDWLTFSPSPLVLSAYEGEPTKFSIRAISNKIVSTSINIAIVDTQGVIAPTVNLTHTSELEYTATLLTATTLMAGVHKTNLEVRLCEDDPMKCSKPLAGSPWYVPLTVNVASTATGAARLQFSRAVTEISTFEGESQKFTIVATAPSFAKNFYRVALVDRSGLTAGTAGSDLFFAGPVSMERSTSPTLAVGAHDGNLELRVCIDDPLVCKLPVSGSPWLVPVKVTVKSTINLSALQAIPQLDAWSTFQGNAAHTGYVPATFDPSKFTRRWDLPAGKWGGALNAVAIDNGSIFAVNSGVESSDANVAAISEESGKYLWKRDLGQVSVNPPAAANGKVYLTTFGSENLMWVIDQKTGSTIAKTVLPSVQSAKYMAPTVANNAVYSGNGYYGGISKFDASNGQLAWTTELSTGQGWTPAVDGNFAYGYLSAFVAFNLNDGSVAYRLPDTENPYNDNAFPVVLGANQMAYMGFGRLTAFDLAKRTRAWEVKFAANGQPAYAKGVLYSLDSSGTRLLAYSADTGALQWSTLSLGYYSLNHVIVTDNLAFVSDDRNTTAIDLKTHAVVWRYPFGGTLAISNRGVLYLVDQYGKIGAVNLQ